MINLKFASRSSTLPPSIKEREAPSIKSLVNSFWYYEKQCDAATEELESKAKSIVRRVERNLVDTSSGVVPNDLARLDAPHDEAIANIEMPTSHIDKAQFKRRAELARKFCVPYRIMAGTQFIQGATEAELQELEELEVTIQLLQFQMHTVETEILDAVPDQAEDAIAKLKFVSCLLIDGCHLEVDSFAYMVKEAIETVDRNLSSILQTYRKHERELS